MDAFHQIMVSIKYTIFDALGKFRNLRDRFKDSRLDDFLEMEDFMLMNEKRCQDCTQVIDVLHN